MASSSPTSSSNEIEKPPIDSKLEKVTELDESDIDEKKLVRKLDWALVPWVSCIHVGRLLMLTSICHTSVSVVSGQCARIMPILSVLSSVFALSSVVPRPNFYCKCLSFYPDAR